MESILFVILFIYLTNWQVVISLSKGSLFSKTKSLPHKPPTTLRLGYSQTSSSTSLKPFNLSRALTHAVFLNDYKNSWLFELLKRKTGIEFNFKKSISDKYSGFHPLYPPNTIVLSSRIWEEFNKDEMEWVALHEAGHRVYHHGYKYIPISLTFMTLGTFILHYHGSLLVNFATIAFLLTPIYQQIIRIFETQADMYAVTKMDNPKGMITGNKKFIKASKSFIYNNDALRFLFTPHLSWQQRIKVAEEEIRRRKKTY